jgi:hypothetical protein
MCTERYVFKAAVLYCGQLSAYSDYDTDSDSDSDTDYETEADAGGMPHIGVSPANA